MKWFYNIEKVRNKFSQILTCFNKTSYLTQIFEFGLVQYHSYFSIITFNHKPQIYWRFFAKLFFIKIWFQSIFMECFKHLLQFFHVLFPCFTENENSIKKCYNKRINEGSKYLIHQLHKTVCCITQKAWLPIQRNPTFIWMHFSKYPPPWYGYGLDDTLNKDLDWWKNWCLEVDPIDNLFREMDIYF